MQGSDLGFAGEAEGAFADDVLHHLGGSTGDGVGAAADETTSTAHVVTRDPKGNAMVMVVSKDNKAEPRPIQTTQTVGVGLPNAAAGTAARLMHLRPRAVVLVGIVVFLFLGKLRTTLIPLVAVLRPVDAEVESELVPVESDVTPVES